MPPHVIARWALLGVLAVSLGQARADEPKEKASREAAVNSQEIRKAAERGLVFLEKDAVKWRKEHQCATCHHGTMTVWAFAEARSQGYDVAAESLAETVKWTKERLKDVAKPRDPRPG